MGKIFEFDPQIYPRKLWVVVNPNYEDINKTFEESIDELEDHYEAIVHHVTHTSSGKGGLLVIFKDVEFMTTSTISHESTHVAIDIFEYTGCRIDYLNQESFAYLVGWIAGCINTVNDGIHSKKMQ